MMSVRHLVRFSTRLGNYNRNPALTSDMAQTTLFGGPRTESSSPGAPLAGRMRPDGLDGFVGQAKLLGDGRPLRMMIERDEVPSIIFWGPPGVGKTTLANIIANRTSAEFVRFSAVTGGIREAKAVMEEAERRRKNGRRTVLFVDEIHRFNRAQQDAFLPYVEKGSITLIGATTENPSFEVNPALLSRCRIFVLDGLSDEDVLTLLRRALSDPKGLDSRVYADDCALGAIARYANGDARTALNALEVCASVCGDAGITENVVVEAVGGRTLLYDRDGEEHYNLISALHKSMKNSDPDAAVYWLARMLDGGEDPVYIARRLIEFSGDDVGLADPNAMLEAVACLTACRNLGMPECRYALAQTAIYLSLAPRSNSVGTAMEAAMKDVREMPAEPVPMHLRNAETKLMEGLGYGKGYQYPEGTPEKITKMQCLPDSLRDREYYRPGDRGSEVLYRRRLREIRAWRAGERDSTPG